MKKNFRLVLSTLALLTLGLTACVQQKQKGQDYSHNNKQVESVTLSTTYEEKEVGDAFSISAEIKYRNDEVVEVVKEWKSSKTSVARLTPNYDDNTAEVSIVGTGTSYITFRAGYEIASCKVYVPESEQPVDPDIPPVDPDQLVISLSVTSRTLEVNGTFNLTATPSKAAEITFSVSNTSVLELVSTTENACVVKGLAEGNADVVATSGSVSAQCHVSVVGSGQQGDKDYTIYFYIDYNNVDPKDNTKLLASFDWYYDRPFSESGQVPTVTNDMALDPAFPYFIGWSAHPIIDTKEDLWDLNNDTVADLPMVSYSVILYGQWMDVPVLPAQEVIKYEEKILFICSCCGGYGLIRMY